MNEKRFWLIASLLVALLITSGLTAYNTGGLRARTETLREVQPAATIYVHGRAWDSETHEPIAGFTAQLLYGGRLVGTSVTNAAGAWGISASVQAGTYELRFTASQTHPRIVQVLRANNVTDFMLAADLQSCTFRVSPAGGVTGDFHVFCAPLAGPTATPTRTATPRPTPTWTPIPPTVTPTWTPGPTPTPCFRDPPPDLLAEVVRRMSAAFPPPDHPLTDFGFTYGLGWPMLEQSMSVNGVGYYGQLWTPFAVVVQHPDGCVSVIDSATLFGWRH